MKVLALNGSPRKTWNTATLLQKALDGAASQGAKTELIHLYDLNFKGCRSCFGCKTKGGESYGRCAVKDDLTPLLKQVAETDALFLGSPIYLGTVSGEMKSFLERLVFPYLTYTDPPASLCPKKIRTGLIYTMGVPEHMIEQVGYTRYFQQNEFFVSIILGACESLFCYDTYQFDDYSKVVADRFDVSKKAARRREVFPLDCQKAFDMGARFAKASASQPSISASATRQA